MHGKQFSLLGRLENATPPTWYRPGMTLTDMERELEKTEADACTVLNGLSHEVDVECVAAKPPGEVQEVAGTEENEVAVQCRSGAWSSC
eukprot:2478582-Amphidinium_carterae.2